jgi:hypothetical protein
MLKRLRLPSPAMVVALMALFAALGGGYATAFSGSGTLQKAAVDGLSTEFETVRTLKGFGTFKARCDVVQDEVEYAIRAPADKSIQYRVSRIGLGTPANTGGGIGTGDLEAIPLGSGSAVGGLLIHLSNTGTLGAKGGVLVAVTNEGPVTDDCSSASTRVRLMALNTVE